MDTMIPLARLAAAEWRTNLAQSALPQAPVQPYVPRRPRRLHVPRLGRPARQSAPAGRCVPAT